MAKWTQQDLENVKRARLENVKSVVIGGRRVEFQDASALERLQREIEGYLASVVRGRRRLRTTIMVVDT